MKFEGESKFNQAQEVHKKKLGGIEERQALVDKYLDVVKSLVSSDLYIKQNGELNGVTLETVFKAGKQQPVSIVKLNFPENISFEIVLRPTGGYYEEFYQQYEAVKKYFPHIYFSSGQPNEATGHKTVLALERIEGYEEKLNGQEFEKHIADPENFEKLCKEVFQMIDELYKEPLILYDISPTGGHNVFFNTNTEKFQLFDVDTLKPSDWAFEKKFMAFVNRGQQMNDKEIHFLMRMIQQYLEQYKDSQLVYEGDEYVKGRYLKVEGSTESLDNVIYPDDPRYEDCYRAIEWRGTRGRKDLLPLTLWKSKGKDHHSINRELIEAVKQNDFEKTKQIVSQLGGRIVEDKFVENEK